MTNIDTIDPGPDLDRLIAEKVIGWKQSRIEPLAPGEIRLGAGSVNIIGEAWESTPPEYSTDIALAWEVVDNMKDNYEFHIENDQGEQYEWMVTIMSLVDGSFGNRVCAEAETAPLAICRAALKAVSS